VEQGVQLLPGSLHLTQAKYKFFPSVPFPPNGEVTNYEWQGSCALAEVTRHATRTGCCVHEYVQRPATMHMIPRISNGNGTKSDPPSQV
jgi:hypothetical protein